MKKMYIFDLDGTLVNTIADLADACNHALAQNGHQTFPTSDYPEMVGNGIYMLMARALRRQGLSADPEGPEVAAMTPFFKNYYDQHLTDHSTPYPGIEKLLQELQQQGVKICVASNKYQAATEQIVQNLFPDIQFSGILGQREGVAKKPDPSIVYELMQMAGISDKSEVLYIGDSNVDIQTAKNAGVDCRAVTWGFCKEDELKVTGTDEELLVHSTQELHYTHWVACWGTATSITDRHEATYARDLTLRYPIFCPFSGNQLRLRFSNLTGTEAVHIDKICVNGLVIDGISIAAGEEVTTPPVSLPVQAGDTLQVSFYLRDFTQLNAGTLVTGPLSGGQFAYGDYAEKEVLPADLTRKTNWYYFLNTIDILTEAKNHAIVCYGDSITAQSWPDYLAKQAWDAGYHTISIIRRAVCGTRVLRQYDCITYQAYGLKGATRFPIEINTAGATDVIVQHGINDIIHPVGTDVNPFRPWSDLPTAEELCNGIQELYVEPSHKLGLRVWGGTLLPIEGWRTYAPLREELRLEVNRWIRENKTLEGLIDFDLAVCDPNHPAAFAPGFDSGDHLHPSESAYAAMAQEALKILTQ